MVGYNTELPISRLEEHVEGEPIAIHGEVALPIQKEDYEIFSGDPWYEEGNMLVIQWWSGYGQRSTMDVYITDDEDDLSNGFSVGNPDTEEEFHEIVRGIKEKGLRAYFDISDFLEDGE